MNFGDLNKGDVFRLATRRDRVLTKVSDEHAVDVLGNRSSISPGWEVAKVRIRRGRGVNADTRATVATLKARANEALDCRARHTFIAPEQLLELIEAAELAAEN